MLAEITIENVAVIEKATADFSGGFNVLTGETGAGKSILIDSINAILGNRTSRDIVRSGAAKAKVWARFAEISADMQRQVEEAGYTPEDELLLYREISAEGKSNCRINGAPATVSALRQLCSGLIQIHGQHDNQNLMNPAKHLEILDAFAQNQQLLAEYREQYQNLVSVRREREKLASSSRDKNRKLDLLRYEYEEIESALIEPGEEDQLLEQRKRIQNAQSIIAGINNAYYSLSGNDEEEGAVSLLAQAANAAAEAAGYADDLLCFSESINDLYYSAQELSSDLQNKLQDYQFSADELNEIEERLDLLYRLKQKYGDTLEEVVVYGEKARKEIETIAFSDERIAELEKQEASFSKQVQKLANAISDSREKAFAQLHTEIEEALDFLNMPGIQIRLQKETIPFHSKGQDAIEFLISTNPGESPKPLAKVASGGELARIMLAFKSALAQKDELATVIYDEIDTGISGLAAGRIGRMLKDTAQGRQVICVTHTAQVASYAASHLQIEKQVREGRTYTNIEQLDTQQRIHELARIISGDNITDIALANAKEMIENANTA